MTFDRDASTRALELVALGLVLANVVAWSSILGRWIGAH